MTFINKTMHKRYSRQQRSRRWRWYWRQLRSWWLSMPLMAMFWCCSLGIISDGGGGGGSDNDNDFHDNDDHDDDDNGTSCTSTVFDRDELYPNWQASCWQRRTLQARCWQGGLVLVRVLTNALLTETDSKAIMTQLKARRRTAKMLIIVVVVFIICFLPVYIWNMIRFVTPRAGSQLA